MRGWRTTFATAAGSRSRYSLARLGHLACVVEAREQCAGVVQGLGIVHPHLCAAKLDRGRHVECGGVADVVAVRFERRAQHRDGAAEERAAHEVAGQLDHPFAAAHVDLVDLLQEAQ